VYGQTHTHEHYAMIFGIVLVLVAPLRCSSITSTVQVVCSGSSSAQIRFSLLRPNAVRFYVCCGYL